jgi:hypothetical protein
MLPGCLVTTIIDFAGSYFTTSKYNHFSMSGPVRIRSSLSAAIRLVS